MFKLTYPRIGRSDFHALKTISKLTMSSFRQYAQPGNKPSGPFSQVLSQMCKVISQVWEVGGMLTHQEAAAYHVLLRLNFNFSANYI